MGDSAVESWTDSLARCALSGCGFVTNAKYTNGPSRSSHEFLHEVLNIHENNVRLLGLFCGYNNDKRAAKFAANRLVYEIFTETPITSGTDPEQVIDQLRYKFDTVVKAYNEEIDELLAQRWLQKDSSTDESDVQLVEINAKLRAGTTVLVVLIIDDNFYVLNCGNSRVLLLSEEGGETQVKELISEHNNDNEQECERILELGLDPARIHRPTRSIGDCFRSRCYTENEELSMASGPPVISTPEILAYKINDNYSSIVLCSETVVTAIEELGVEPEKVNKYIEDAIAREAASATSTSYISIAQAVLDSLTRKHREQYLSGEADGMYNNHEDLSLILAYFRSVNDRSRFTMTVDINSSLSIEESEEVNSNVPIAPYVDFDNFDTHEKKDEILKALDKIFEGDIRNFPTLTEEEEDISPNG